MYTSKSNQPETPKRFVSPRNKKAIQLLPTEESVNAYLFIKKRNKTDTKGMLYLRCNMAGETIEHSFGIYITEAEWDNDNKLIMGEDQLNQHIQKEKDAFILQLREAYAVTEQMTGLAPNLKTANAILKGKTYVPETIMEIFVEEIDRMRSSNGEGCSAANVQKHEVCRNHLTDFLNNNYRRNDISLMHLNKKFVLDFIDFLRTEKNCQHNTTIKHVQIFKKIYRIALDNRWVDHNAFAGIKLGLKTVSREYLTQEEIDTIAKKDLHNNRLSQIRDYFIFSCYTGLAYIDLINLKKKNITEYLGRQWINIERTKTNVSASIPLLAPARLILDALHPGWKLSSAETLMFKKLSNQKINSYLKEIAVLTNIEKHVSFHLARHSFATSVTLSNNIPIETVSRMMGHTRITMTQHYSKVIDQKVARDTEALSKRLDKKYRDKS